MGKHGEKKMFVNAPLNQLFKMYVPGDGRQLPTQKNRRAFVPVLLSAPIALRPALGLKAGMELAAIMEEGEHRYWYRHGFSVRICVLTPQF